MPLEVFSQTPRWSWTGAFLAPRCQASRRPDSVTAEDTACVRTLSLVTASLPAFQANTTLLSPGGSVLFWGPVARRVWASVSASVSSPDQRGAGGEMEHNTEGIWEHNRPLATARRTATVVLMPTACSLVVRHSGNVLCRPWAPGRWQYPGWGHPGVT